MAETRQASGRKMIVIDLDGTLFNSKKEVSRLNLDVLLRCVAAGHLIVIATARPRRTVLRRLPEALHDCYLVLCNGAWVMRDQRIVYRNELAAAQVREAVRHLQARGYEPAIEANDTYFTDGKSDFDPAFVGHVFPLNAFNAETACKILAHSESGFDDATIRDSVPDDLSFVITDNGTLIQIARSTCSKLTACLEIMSVEGIECDDACAFGDDHNDMPLFEAVGVGIAMANAVEPLKKIAHFVTSSNDDDGVGRWISRHVLGEAE